MIIKVKDWPSGTESIELGYKDNDCRDWEYRIWETIKDGLPEGTFLVKIEVNINFSVAQAPGQSTKKSFFFRVEVPIKEE